MSCRNQSGTARLRFTNTFIKRDGHWQAVASHATHWFFKRHTAHEAQRVAAGC
jgi:hypothetical protein